MNDVVSTLLQFLHVPTHCKLFPLRFAHFYSFESPHTCGPEEREVTASLPRHDVLADGGRGRERDLSLDREQRGHQIDAIAGPALDLRQ